MRKDGELPESPHSPPRMGASAPRWPQGLQNPQHAAAEEFCRSHPDRGRWKRRSPQPKATCRSFSQCCGSGTGQPPTPFSATPRVRGQNPHTRRPGCKLKPDRRPLCCPAISCHHMHLRPEQPLSGQWTPTPPGRGRYLKVLGGGGSLLGLMPQQGPLRPSPLFPPCNLSRSP